MQRLSLEQVDALLLGWEDWLRRVDDNLLALESDATYQALSGPRGQRARLEGATRDRVLPALDAVGQLFADRARLRAVIDRAREVREQLASPLGFWGKDDKLAEIERLLKGQSIVLGTETTPLARRSLLDAGPREVALEPEIFLAQMAATYERARDAFSAIARALRELEPPLGRLEDEARALQRAADRAGHPELSEAAAALCADAAALRDRCARDPLGADATESARLGPRLAQLRARVEAAQAEQARVVDALAEADSTRKHLGEAHALASASLDELLREVEVGPGASALLASPAELADLDDWLAKLRLAVEGGHTAPAVIGLARWSTAASELFEKTTSARNRATTLLARRAELAGRLSARRAQAQALVARGGSLPAATQALADEADALLRTRPTPIARAVSAVEAFEQAVAAARARIP
jgi:hypothetical protein